VCAGGVPIGVVQVKKPGNDILLNPLVVGQLFDYMLRLQSYFGLEHVFGLVSTYEKWRVCWLPLSESAATATSTTEAEDEDASETHTVVPERVLHGGSLCAWDDENLPRILCTTILKMYNSPRSQVSWTRLNGLGAQSGWRTNPASITLCCQQQTSSRCLQIYGRVLMDAYGALVLTLDWAAVASFPCVQGKAKT
jgi:hypothetical protein